MQLLELDYGGSPIAAGNSLEEFADYDEKEAGDVEPTVFQKIAIDSGGDTDDEDAVPVTPTYAVSATTGYSPATKLELRNFLIVHFMFGWKKRLWKWPARHRRLDE